LDVAVTDDDKEPGSMEAAALEHLVLWSVMGRRQKQTGRAPQ
jgi:hypothetical protein